MADQTHALADPLAGGHAALAPGRWEHARHLFQAALARGESGEAWEGLGWAAWWLDDESLTLDSRERAFRCYPADGHHEYAEHANGRGEAGHAGGSAPPRAASPATVTRQT
jgi:hypothetical protein